MIKTTRRISFIQNLSFIRTVSATPALYSFINLTLTHSHPPLQSPLLPP